MKDTRIYASTRSQHGVTLVELMVSITIGLIISLFLASLYLGSQSSYRINDNSAKMQDEGRMALNLVGRNLIQAGFGNLMSSDYSSNTSRAALTDFGGEGLRGCDRGFAASGNLADLSCNAAGMANPAFQVSYRAEDTSTDEEKRIGVVTDCNGQTPALVAGQRVITNRFYLNLPPNEAVRSLYCLGNGGSAQPVLGNVENMQVTYGLSPATYPANDKMPYDANGYRSVERYVAASDIADADWPNVLSVNVCLELSSPNDNPESVVSLAVNRDCTGAVRPHVDGDRRLYTVVRGVFTLRNNASARNFTMK